MAKELKLGFKDASGLLAIKEDDLGNKIVKVAKDEADYWKMSINSKVDKTYPTPEDTPAGDKRVKEYLNFTFGSTKSLATGKEFSVSSEAWSAIFVSYCVKKAFQELYGEVSDEKLFKELLPVSPHPRHMYYAHEAYKKKEKGLRGYYWAFANQAILKLGDIIVRGRAGKHYNYSYLKKNNTGESHADIVVELDADTVKVIGGNVSLPGEKRGTTVFEKTYPLKEGKLDLSKGRASGVFTVLSLMPEQRAIASSGETHSITLTMPPQDYELDRMLLQLRLVMYGEPLSDVNYTLMADKNYSGTTDAEGNLEQVLPAETYQASLALEDWGTLSLELGDLNPSFKLQGVQERLANLGYACGVLEGQMNPETLQAIKRFQEEHELEVDGIVGPKTQAKLEELYGS